MDDKFQKLHALGAGDFEHIDGSLIEHLKNTSALLKSWSASSTLQDAGLYHAAYGTISFHESLVSAEQREKISAIIGLEAEQIVYLYCACDRDYFWPQIGIRKTPEFKNRFTGGLFELDEHQLHYFCELTVANELEIAENNPAFIIKYGEYLKRIFLNMKQHLSNKASMHARKVLFNINE